MSWRPSAGLRTWLLQRLSATYIALFLGIFAIKLIAARGGEPLTYEVWRAWVSHPVSNIALILFIFALLLHAWVGVRDVIMDYVNSVPLRYVLLIGFGLSFIGMALWTLRTLLLVTSVATPL
ncbi:MAG: succinate dehydrogenase, hydrophobic membrane anchor protein [Gammaproteobacteria bacterium]|nr:succinate dehydrogenase, hydrophobic membrane anchor protein [Gammaproteobacteria bacterium]